MSEQSTSAPNPSLVSDLATAPPQPVAPRRACTECRRKKAKCDMKRPFCSLCLRIGESCIYPVRRANRRKHRGASTPTSQSQEVTGLTITTIDPGSFDALLPSTSFCTQYATGPGMSQSLPSASIPDGNLHFPELVSGQYPGFSPPKLDESGLVSELPSLPLFDPGSLGEFTSPDYDSLWDSDPKHTEACQPGPKLPNANPIGLASPRGFTRLRFDIQVSASVAQDLIDGFFKHVHHYLPLFNSRSFKRSYSHLSSADGQHLEDLSLEKSLILNGMMAVSTRFSMLPAFKDEKRAARGQRFFQEASRLYDIWARSHQIEDASLELLQGLILLTFNSIHSGPSRQAWLLCSVCARLAYALDLQNTDADIIAGENSELVRTEEFLQAREERRRAWWVIWDMDTFINSLALTPFALDLRHANVLLPMADDDWLEAKDCTSTYLDAKSEAPWRNLSSLPKQSTWAWFLAATTIMRQAVDAASSPVTVDELGSIQFGADCLAMALPEVFEIDSASSAFTPHNFGEMNWVMSTLILLQCAQSLLQFQKTADQSRRHYLCLRPHLQQQRAGMPYPRRQPDSLRFRNAMAKICRAWSPQYLIFSIPFVAFGFAGPGCLHLLGPTDVNRSNEGDLDIVRLALRRLARYWDIAEILLDTLPMVTYDSSNTRVHERTDHGSWPPALYLRC